MATTQIPWGDGSNDKLYFDTDSMVGNQTVAVSSDPNSGASERSKIVNFNASGVQPQPLQIVQLAGGGGTDFDAWLKDGDTHLWINILNDYQLDQQISIQMIGTIDWGDGSAKESVSVNTYTTFTHTYSAKGKYRIDLHPTSGTFRLGGGGSNFCIMGARSDPNSWRVAVLYQIEIGSSIINTLNTYAISTCRGLIRAYIPKNITTIASNAFSNSPSLRELVFEDITRISSIDLANTFQYSEPLQTMSGGWFVSSGTAMTATYRNCYCLREIVIPASVTSIATYTFYNAYGLAFLKCLPTSPPTVANANAFTNIQSTCKFQVPIGSLESYQSANIWRNHSSKMVEAGAITINLTRVSIGNKDPMATKNGRYTTTLIADDGYTISSVVVKMGGVDVTNTVYSNGVITIASVTGNIEITATAA